MCVYVCVKASDLAAWENVNAISPSYDMPELYLALASHTEHARVTSLPTVRDSQIATRLDLLISKASGPLQPPARVPKKQVQSL